MDACTQPGQVGELRGREGLYSSHLARPSRPTPPRALAPGEREAVLDTLHSERFMDHAPAEIHSTLLDEGTYLCLE